MIQRTSSVTRNAAPLVLIALGGALTGCGGHHSSTQNPTSFLTATIDWPAQSRDVTNVSSAAQAAIITVTSGDPNTGDPVDFPPIIRGQDPVTYIPLGNGLAAYQQAWKSPTQIRVGATKVQIRFYATLPTGVTGTILNSRISTSYALLPSVGDVINSPITVPAPTTLSPTFDIGVLTVKGTIAAISIATTTTNFGNNAVLPVTAYDSNQKVLFTLAQGSAFFTVAPGNPPLVDASGNLSGVALGTAMVTAKVDTVVSPAVAVSAIVGINQTATLAGGVQYRDTVPGTGAPAASGQPVTLNYTGYFSSDPNNVDSGNYTAFDTASQSQTKTVTLGSGALPQGLDQGVVGMLSHGTRIIVVPASLSGDAGLPPAAAKGPAIYIIKRLQ